jgi:hypothetical protein
MMSAMHYLITLGLVVAGALAGLVIGFIVAVVIPGQQPWLGMAGLVAGGWAASWYRRFH